MLNMKFDGKDYAEHGPNVAPAVHRGVVDGVALCRLFNRAIHTQVLPKYLSSDHDPWYLFHQGQANLRVLEIHEIKTVPYVPLSHLFVERRIGTIRREYLDQTLFWDVLQTLPGGAL